jgi:DnaD/phage-associated family protein
MSIEIMNRVWNQSQQQGTKLVLLLALADMANTSGYCWPSLETLQQRARLSHRQNIIKAIAEMESNAEVWVEHNRGRNHSNTYIVTVGMGADELAKTLITYFDYSPSDAMQKANDFLKRSPQTTLSDKCSPQAVNVVEGLHLPKQNVVVEQENVVVGLIKCSPQTTRSVIEPPIETTTTTAPSVVVVTAGDVFELWKNNMPGSLTEIIVDELNDFIDTYGATEVDTAIRIAVKQGKRNTRYIHGVLKKRADGSDHKPLESPPQQVETSVFNLNFASI